ncbi:MAG TPA: hypothetical protein DIT76_02625 [Spartobacteria bacterium]|nr:hypothetical protein [Spartobacteria bacterium]HCP90936.1 hypothetical protein [Spartobacteria bacterium]
MAFRSCRWLRQQGRHDAASGACVKSKMPLLPLEKELGEKTSWRRKDVKNNRSSARCLSKGTDFSLSIFPKRASHEQKS